MFAFELPSILFGPCPSAIKGRLGTGAPARITRGVSLPAA